MEQSTARYYFRKRDYAKIRNWYEMAKDNFVPDDTLQTKKSQKSKEWHFKFEFGSIDLNQQYANSILKSVTNIKEVIIHSNIFQRSSGCVVSSGKQLIRQCTFNPTNYTLIFSEEVVLYFYIDDITPRDYQFCIEVQIVTKQGNFLKLASSKYYLGQAKENKKSEFVLYSNHYERFQFEEEKSPKGKAAKKQAQPQTFSVGVIQMEQQVDEIKDISRYLPQLRIIDQNSKLPPCSNFNLKKKKEQIIIDPPFKVTLQSLLIKVTNPNNMRSQILNNNPFTMSHKELVQFQIKQYAITIDMHNGWKFINQHKNIIPMQLIVQNQQEIYISSKQTEKLNLSYFDNDFTLFVIILTCQVQFKIKQTIGEKRTSQFVIGWLPLPLDLSLKQNKMELFFVNDHPFPTSLLPHLNLQSNFTANFTHPLYQKYKVKADDKKVLMNQLPIPFTSSSQPNRYLKVHKRMKTTETFSSNQIAERQAHIDYQIQALKAIIERNQKQVQTHRLVPIYGKTDNGQVKVNHECELNMEELVGKILRVRIQLKSLIAQSQIPSSYYLPRKLEGRLYFLRQNYDIKLNITQEKAKFHIPISLNCNHSYFNFKIHLYSVQEYETVINSHLVLVLYEEGSDIMYAKGVVRLPQILGHEKRENICYLRLNKWNQSGYKLFGTLLINSFYQLQKVKQNHTKGEEFSIQKQMHKLSMEERLKMRIGNFKGDQQSKIKAVSILKQKKHAQFVSNVVDSEFMSEGEIIYELGFDSFYLLAFTNEDKSENNIFTFHLNCPYAQLVTNEKDYRQIVSSLNPLKFIAKQNSSLSYYQTSLQFNESIGLLLRLNVNQLKQGFALKRIQVTVRRNTLQTKKFILKCTYKEPIIWDVQQSHELLHHAGQQLRLAATQQLNTRYKDISVLNENIKYDYRTKEFIFLKRIANRYELLCFVTPAHSKIPKIIIYKVQFFPGRNHHVQAGQKIGCFIQFQDKYPIQIIRSHSKKVQIPSLVRFSQFKTHPDELLIQILEPIQSHPITISTYDLSGQKLWTYLLKVTASLSTNCRKIEIAQNQMEPFSLNCQNPYACHSQFYLVCQSKALKIQNKIEIDEYGEKLILGRLLEWAQLQNSIYVFMNDMRGNVIQSWQLVFLREEQNIQS